MKEFGEKAAFRKRTKLFGLSVVKFCGSLDGRRGEVKILRGQLLRAGTSVGANYREASRARSDAEFVAKIELCAQEADETQYWLELLTEGCGVSEDRTGPIHAEADELISIFVTMAKNTKARVAAQKRKQN